MLFLPDERVADALHALVVIGRRGAARLDTDRAAFGLDRHDELGEVHADFVIMRADIGNAQPLVLGRADRSPRSGSGYWRLCAPCSAAAIAGGVGRRYADTVDLLGDQVGDHLRLFVAAAMLSGADIEAFDLAVEFLLGLLAAGPAWSKNGLLVFFGTSAKVYILSAATVVGMRDGHTAASAEATTYLIIPIPPWVSSNPDCPISGSFAPFSAHPFEQNRGHDEEPDEEALPVRIDTGHQQRIPDHFDESRADEGAEHAALAAHQIGPADHRGSDGAKFIGLCRGVDRRTRPANGQDARSAAVNAQST